MNMKIRVMFLGLLSVLSLVAAQAPKAIPVAPGYPDWQGLTNERYASGRRLEPADLRHKVTVVFHIELGPDLIANMRKIVTFVYQSGRLSGYSTEDDWLYKELGRDLLVVVSVHKAKVDEIRTAMRRPADCPQADRGFWWAMTVGQSCSTYEEITFPGAPDNGGKFPYAIVMGPTGTEPLSVAALDSAGIKATHLAIAKGLSAIKSWKPQWRPFYGTIDVPRYNTDLAKALDKASAGKRASLASVEKSLLADIAKSDPEKANEAQILYDAIVQTRNDLVMRINSEYSVSPVRAHYDIQELLKYWPECAKRVKGAMKKVKEQPETEVLGKMYARMRTLASPDYTCKNSAEMKRVMDELAAMKKKLGLLKVSRNVSSQGVAYLLDAKLDELMASLPDKIGAGS